MPGRYVTRRVLFAVTTVFVAATLNFVLFHALPGDVASLYTREPGMTAEALDAIRRQHGLDRPLAVQYGAYLAALARGDLGRSLVSGQPIAALLRTAVVNSAQMTALGTGFAIVLGISVGTVAAWRRGTRVDRATLGTALLFYSLPSQWLGLMMIVLFGAYLPAGGRQDPFLFDPSTLEHLLDVGRHLVLPSATLGLVLFGQYAVFARAALLSTLGDDYVLTARAKGLAEVTIMRRHVLRNALLPISTLVALSLGGIVSGSILIETVFSWPGVGTLIYRSVGLRDWPALQGAFLVITIATVACNLLADLLYGWLDPRVVDGRQPEHAA